MPFQSPLNEIRFILSHLVPYGEITAFARFEHAAGEASEAVLTEAARLCDEVLAPLNRIGDTSPARLENGVVITPPGFAAAYRMLAEGGWVGMAASTDHGMGLPMVLTTAVNEMMGAACLALQLNPLMAQGQIEALEHHGSDAQKALYLPKLISGEWTATMNLTEPQAGSDVGALTTRAERRDDGSYAITGQKIFITWADHDFGGNVSHLVLARATGAPDGTRGLSLFLVPKFMPNPDGSLGARNSLGVVSLEHKLGIHGSPTAVMEYRAATGFLVGAEGEGMKAMFTMMNNARLGVSTQGTSQAEAAFQAALAFARERVQGKTASGEATIIGHADVRRMLARMKAEILAARSIELSCAAELDLARATASETHQRRASFLTPIAKAFCTEVGMRVSEQAVQVFGGMGYIEETGVSQFSRDVRITAIYEGTNGIQAMDLVGRKLADGGEIALALIDEVLALCETSPGGDLAAPLRTFAQALREATTKVLALPPLDRQAGALPYLFAFARVLGGAAHLKAAAADPTRQALASFYMERLLPEVSGLLAEATAGAAGVYAVKLD